MAPMGTLSFNDAYEQFAVQVKAGREAGADLIYRDHVGYIRGKGCCAGSKEHSNSGSVFSDLQKNGRTLMGNDALTAVTVLEGLKVDAIGVNCSLGPEELLPVIEKLTKSAHVPYWYRPIRTARA